MKLLVSSTKFVVLALSASLAVLRASAACQTSLGGPCGDASSPREANCCDTGYCQPWNSGYYQCIAKPSVCPTQETGIDYYGNDITTVYDLQPNTCCDACLNTAGCRGYTFVNENPDGKTACYLKASTAGRVEKKGAVSGVLATVTTPPANCSNTVGSYCGNAQTGPACCGENAFCQPWNAGYYQCVAKPLNAKCPTVVVGVDFTGFDIETRYSLLPDSCCDACYNHPQCHMFTFVNENADGRSACYLKSGLGVQRSKASAISGYKVKM